MQNRMWGVSAAALALTCLTVTGCGTQQHHVTAPSHTSKNESVPSNSSNRKSSVDTRSDSTSTNHTPSVIQTNPYSGIRKLSHNERFQKIIEKAMAHVTGPKFPLVAPTLPGYHPSNNVRLFLGATTGSSPHSYRVSLQWAHSQLPVNSPSLSMPPNTGDAAIVGSFGGTQYSSSKAALERLDIQQINPRLLPPAKSKSVNVTLVDNIQGTEYSFPYLSGKVYWLIWHQDDWQLEVAGAPGLPAISVAKEVSTYFHNHDLPSKNGVFIVGMAADGNHTSALWVNGNVLYSCSDYHSALQAAKMLVSMRLYP